MQNQKDLLDEVRDTISYFKQNPSALTAFGAIVIAFLGGTLRLNDYLNYTFLSSYYGISLEYYNYNEISAVFLLLICTLFICLFAAIIYSYRHFVTCLKRGNSKKGLPGDIVILFAFNLIVYLFLLSLYKNAIHSALVLIFLYIPILLFITIKKKIMKLIRKKTSTEESYVEAVMDFKLYLRNLPILFLLTLVLTHYLNFLSYQLKKDYLLVDSSGESCAVAIYSTQDYFVTLECEIQDDNLTIYKGSQNKISNDNVKTQKITFDRVNIKQKGR